MRTTTRSVAVEISFAGDGRVVGSADGFSFSGGVSRPQFDGQFAFSVYREIPDEAGLWNPEPGCGTFAGSLQVNLWADSAGYRELAKYFLALAELDARADPGFHEHHELQSADGQTRIHLICRKAPPEEWLP